MCAGKDSNLRSPKATDLQSVVIDHSTTDATKNIVILAKNNNFTKQASDIPSMLAFSASRCRIKPEIIL